MQHGAGGRGKGHFPTSPLLFGNSPDPRRQTSCTFDAGIRNDDYRTGRLNFIQICKYLGVDAIASIPPIYFHLPEYAIAKYWNDMSAAAPNTEFVIYNIPQLAGTGLTMSLLKEMLKNPNVIAVKNSSMPTQDIQMFKDAGIAARGEGNFVVFNGPDEQFVSGRVIGADGGIGGTYAVMPELYLAMNDHINKGEIEAARAIQYDADRIIYKMCEAHGNLYAVQKEILRRMYGLELGGVREPMPGLIPEDEAIVAEAQAMIEAAIAKL